MAETGPPEAKPANIIPKPVDFFLTVPLYEKTSYSGVEVWSILDTLYYRGTYDSFCTKCQRESTFQVVAPERPGEHIRNLEREKIHRQQGVPVPPPSLKQGIHTAHAYCTRTNSHSQDFIFLIDTNFTHGNKGEAKFISTFEKIGQQPSYGDLHRSEVKQYVPVLTNEQLGEFTRAIGLASHDVGIGAYVYLRRIFEALVEEAHKVAKTDKGWDEEAYARLRMAEKITVLKGHLPEFLVEHASMYSLLSNGIHELSEQVCLKHFDTLRLGIEMILDEKLEQKKRAIKSAQAKAALNAAMSETKEQKKS